MAAMALAGCGGVPKHSAPTGPVAPAPPSPTPAVYPSISRSAFGMHWLDYRTPARARMTFGAVRLEGGNAITWPMLQPTARTPLDPSNPAVVELDATMASYRRQGVQPLIVLGPTPAWAGEKCPHGTWPVETCAPADRGSSSPWAHYVQFLAQRYPGATFEMWNEPNLRNGYNDTVEHLAELQRTTYNVLKNANPSAVLVSPTVGVTAGDPIPWLTKFFAAPGGKDFDVFGVHLYSADSAARAGTGPEWSLDMLHQVSAGLSAAGVSRPIWDTEVNVGRYDFRNTTSRAFIGPDGAAMVTRTYALQLGSGVRRVYWYAGDDRSWGGTWMVNGDDATLTQAGQAYDAAFRLLVGTAPRGCSNVTGVWTCRFAGPSGSVQVLWTTSSSARCTFPGEGAKLLDVLGRPQGTVSSTPLRLSAVPTYVVGAFPVDSACS